MTAQAIHLPDGARSVDDDCLSVNDDDEVSKSSETSRDEMKEVRKIIVSDERKINIWRCVVVVIVASVGVAVTWMTYSSIVREETKSFESAVSESTQNVLPMVNQQKRLNIK